MKKNKTIVVLLVSLVFVLGNASAFEQGWVLNMKANVGGSLTIPSISQADLDYLGANKMEGTLGFVAAGKAEVGYIFDSPTYFNLPNDHVFSGVGAFGYIGVGEGFAGQISGKNVEGQQVNVFMNIHYTPVISLGATGKAYFFNNRLAVGLSAGMKMIADTAPEYEQYADVVVPGLESTVGTIIVDDWMMKNMNPFTASFELLVEYNVPILPTMELILGGYTQFNIFKPKYITMPPSLAELAVGEAQSKYDKGERDEPLDLRKPIKSYFINSFDFGLTISLGFKL